MRVVPWGTGGLQTPWQQSLPVTSATSLTLGSEEQHTHRLHHRLKATFFPHSKNLSLVSKAVLEFGRRSLSHRKPSLNISLNVKHGLCRGHGKVTSSGISGSPVLWGLGLFFSSIPHPRKAVLYTRAVGRAGCSQGQKCCSCLSFPSKPSSVQAAGEKQPGAVLVGRQVCECCD